MGESPESREIKLTGWRVKTRDLRGENCSEAYGYRGMQGAVSDEG